MMTFQMWDWTLCYPLSFPSSPYSILSSLQEEKCLLQTILFLPQTARKWTSPGKGEVLVIRSCHHDSGFLVSTTARQPKLETVYHQGSNRKRGRPCRVCFSHIAALPSGLFPFVDLAVGGYVCVQYQSRRGLRCRLAGPSPLSRVFPVRLHQAEACRSWRCPLFRSCHSEQSEHRHFGSLSSDHPALRWWSGQKRSPPTHVRRASCTFDQRAAP